MVDKTIPKNPMKSSGSNGGILPRMPWSSGQGWNDSEHKSYIVPRDEDRIREQQQEDRTRRDQNRSMIHDAFPPQGSLQPSYMGSQSDTPDKTGD